MKRNEPVKTVRKISLWRVFILVLILSGLGYGSVSGWNRWKEAKVIAPLKPWFAPYVDVTAKPTYAFEQLGATENPHVVLAFIVSSKEDECVPTWGTYYTLDEASGALDLDRRIARLQQQDGTVAVSFGGLLNDELAVTCADEQRLFEAYRSVIERYQIDTVDLDLENEGLRNQEAAIRRAKVMANLQAERRASGNSLAIWLTLPIAPQGLTVEGTTAVATLLSQGVDLAGVNGMTMDYGGSKEEGMSMREASEKALMELHRQLGILYEQAGIHLQSRTLWRKIGATPMIGQNDIAGEIFTLEDANGFNEFAVEREIGRMSMWSANRDVQCGGNYVDVTVVSDSCSGVAQDPQIFAQVLSRGFEGTITQNATLVTIADGESKEQIVDDPETSPYQIWDEKGAYIKGTKVVWHRNVYEAKWWTKGDMPDNPVLQAWETPWQLIGPVLPGEKPIPQPTLPVGLYPEWNGTRVYDAGDRILFEGTAFEAKWWNQGQSPAAAAANADSSPWEALPLHEIKQILSELE